MRTGTKGQATIQKPRHDFPLTPHRGAKQWCKKINGRVHYFGKLDDPNAAEKRYDAEKADLEAGRVPRRFRSRPERWTWRSSATHF